jgi:arylsulfatase A-like enzyme
MMNNIRTTSALLFCSILLLSCASNRSKEKTSRLPNIIFIMSDDQGYADLGCYDGPYVQTPHLDRMAAEGLRFTQVYAGSPVCAPTRNALMTGQHSGHITRRGNRATHRPDLPFAQQELVPLRDEDYTIGEMMKAAGYTTGMIGKWGLGNPGTTGTPDRQGFDHYFGYLDQVHAHDYYTTYLMRNGDTLAIPENENGQRRVYSHDLLAKDALDFIREHQQEPFFLYLPFTPPHGRYEVPDNSAYADQDWPEQVKNYAAMITRMDRDIGRIFELLKELNLDEQTIVFFTSDHGPNPPFVKAIESNKPFRGVKRQVLEGGLRVPMIVRWPGKVPAGQVSDFVWAFWDVMPTPADLAGIPTPEQTDGISVLPTLLGKSQEGHEFLYWEFYDPFQQAVRLGDWKGIRLGLEEPLHLFNLSEDIREERNVAAAHPEIVQKIEAIMAAEHTPNEFWPPLKKADERAQGMLE